MSVLKIAMLIACALSGCSAALFPPIATDRTGSSEAWYYERLTPYYRRCCMDRVFADIAAVYSFQEVVDAAQVQR